MLEQFIAPDYYELMKLLAATIDPAEFPQEGLKHFKLIEVAPGVFEPRLDSKVYLDDMVFMEEVSCQYKLFAFVCNRNGEITLGVKLPWLMGEFVWSEGKWMLLNYEDFGTRPETPAEMRFAISKDFENLKHFLS